MLDRIDLAALPADVTPHVKPVCGPDDEPATCPACTTDFPAHHNNGETCSECGAWLCDTCFDDASKGCKGHATPLDDDEESGTCGRCKKLFHPDNVRECRECEQKFCDKCVPTTTATIFDCINHVVSPEAEVYETLGPLPIDFDNPYGFVGDAYTFSGSNASTPDLGDGIAALFRSAAGWQHGEDAIREVRNRLLNLLERQFVKPGDYENGNAETLGISDGKFAVGAGDFAVKIWFDASRVFQDREHAAKLIDLARSLNETIPFTEGDGPTRTVRPLPLYTPDSPAFLSACLSGEVDKADLAATISGDEVEFLHKEGDYVVHRCKLQDFAVAALSHFFAAFLRNTKLT